MYVGLFLLRLLPQIMRIVVNSRSTTKVNSWSTSRAYIAWKIVSLGIHEYLGCASSMGWSQDLWVAIAQEHLTSGCVVKRTGFKLLASYQGQRDSWLLTKRLHAAWSEAPPSLPKEQALAAMTIHRSWRGGRGTLQQDCWQGSPAGQPSRFHTYMSGKTSSTQI